MRAEDFVRKGECRRNVTQIRDRWHENAGAREVQLASDCSIEGEELVYGGSPLCVEVSLLHNVERNLKIGWIEPSQGRSLAKLNMVQL